LTPLEQDALAIVFKLIDGAGLGCNDYDPPAKKNRALDEFCKRLIK
jgi:hypothetical protein